MLAVHIQVHKKLIDPKEKSRLRGGYPSLHEEWPLLRRRWTSTSPHHKRWLPTSEEEEEASSADVLVRIHGFDLVKPSRNSTGISAM
jgi:hypothetical protein